MMKSFVLFTVAGLLAASAHAAPKDLFARQGTCNKDNCYRQVVASGARPGPVTASNDCASFFRRTVTPCPVTSTSTTTITVSESPSTVTATSTLLTTSIALTTSEIVSVLTTVETQTTSEATVTPFATTTTTTVTSTVVVNTYVTVAGPPPAGPAKRGARVFDIRQVASSCSPTTKTATSVPSYATSCSGTARYSSACQCVGATSSTVILPPSTVTVVSTVRATTPPPAVTTRAVVTSVQVGSSVVVTTRASTVTQTSVTTITITSTMTMIVSETATTTTTTTATPTAYAEVIGFYLQAQRPDGTVVGTIEFEDASQPISIYILSPNNAISRQDINSKGQLRANGYGDIYINGLGVNDPPQQLQILKNYQPVPDERALNCRIADPVAKTGRLTCDVQLLGPVNFYLCAENDKQYLYFGTANTNPTDCYQVNLFGLVDQ